MCAEEVRVERWQKYNTLYGSSKQKCDQIARRRERVIDR